MSTQSVEELSQLIEQKRAALAAIAAAMAKEGASLREIGDKMGISHETVRKWLKRTQRGME